MNSVKFASHWIPRKRTRNVRLKPPHLLTLRGILRASRSLPPKPFAESQYLQVPAVVRSSYVSIIKKFGLCGTFCLFASVTDVELRGLSLKLRLPPLLMQLMETMTPKL